MKLDSFAGRTHGLLSLYDELVLSRIAAWYDRTVRRIVISLKITARDPHVRKSVLPARRRAAVERVGCYHRFCRQARRTARKAAFFFPVTVSDRSHLHSTHFPAGTFPVLLPLTNNVTCDTIRT
jgi:hypothetical protein